MIWGTQIFGNHHMFNRINVHDGYFSLYSTFNFNDSAYWKKIGADVLTNHHLWCPRGVALGQVLWGAQVKMTVLDGFFVILTRGGVWVNSSVSGKTQTYPNHSKWIKPGLPIPRKQQLCQNLPMSSKSLQHRRTLKVPYCGCDILSHQPMDGWNHEEAWDVYHLSTGGVKWST